MYLIQAEEVRRHAMVGAKINTSMICKAIPIVEMKMFGDDFGDDFYEDLKNDLIDYSAAPVFAIGTNYTAGQNVVFEGLVYRVLQNTTGTQIPMEASTYFAIADKFATPAYQKLWKLYLVIILAMAVGAEMVIPSAVLVDDKGAMRVKTDMLESASVGEVSMRKNNDYDLVRAHIINMERFILKNATDYPNYKKVLENKNKCGTSKPSKAYRSYTQSFWIPKYDD